MVSAKHIFSTEMRSVIGADAPKLETATVELPHYDVRRLVRPRDPLSSVDAFICLRARSFGTTTWDPHVPLVPSLQCRRLAESLSKQVR